MKRARFVLPALVFLLVPVGQIENIAVARQIEHSSTPEQCRADADAWNIPTPMLLANTEQQFTEFSSATALDRSLTANTLDARMKELSQCIRADRTSSERYAEANRAYAIAKLVRMGNFMKRHNLTSQFLAEDEQGQR